MQVLRGLGFFMCFLALVRSQEIEEVTTTEEFQRPPPMNMDPVVQDITVSCEPEKMKVDVYTTGDFSGKIYPKGYFKRPECVQTFDAETSPVVMNLTFNSVEDCGMIMEQGDDKTSFVSVIVVQPHQKLITMMARAYQIRCTYDYSGSRLTDTGFTGVVNSEFNVSMLGTVWEDSGPGLSLRVLESAVDPMGITPVNATAAPPAAELSIFKANNVEGEEVRPVERVNIGELLQLRIDLKGEKAREMYGIYIRSCDVVDAMGMDKQNLIDEDGCAPTAMVFPHFQYNDQLNSAATYFKAHKFPYTAEVQYICYIDFCMKVNGGCNSFANKVAILESGSCPRNITDEDVNSISLDGQTIQVSSSVGGRGEGARILEAERLETDANKTDPFISVKIGSDDDAENKTLSVEISGPSEGNPFTLAPLLTFPEVNSRFVAVDVESDADEPQFRETNLPLDNQAKSRRARSIVSNEQYFSPQVAPEAVSLRKVLLVIDDSEEGSEVELQYPASPNANNRLQFGTTQFDVLPSQAASHFSSKLKEKEDQPICAAQGTVNLLTIVLAVVGGAFVITLAALFFVILRNNQNNFSYSTSKA